MVIPRKEQFSGCLVGQCLGDALGFVVEGCSTAICQRYVTEILRTGRAGERNRSPFPFGQYTDDSQLARELIQSYISCKQFNPADYAKRIAAIFLEDRIVGRGLATEKAAIRLIRGAPWEAAGTPSPSAGNGSAMRAGPIGLLFFDDPPLLIQAAHNQGRITHQDKRCSAGAVSIAGAVALAIQTRAINTTTFIRQVSEWTQTFDQSTAACIRQLTEWVSLPPDKAVIYISRAGLPHDYSDGWQGISPFVTSSVIWSLYSFLKSPDDYWGTLCTAIAVGGDVDTTAAMAGAISGAYLGIEGIPLHLAHRLTDQGSWNFAELVELACQCYELKMNIQNATKKRG